MKNYTLAIAALAAFALDGCSHRPVVHTIDLIHSPNALAARHDGDSVIVTGYLEQGNAIFPTKHPEPGTPALWIGDAGGGSLGSSTGFFGYKVTVRGVLADNRSSVNDARVVRVSQDEAPPSTQPSAPISHSEDHEEALVRIEAAEFRREEAARGQPFDAQALGEVHPGKGR